MVNKLIGMHKQKSSRHLNTYENNIQAQNQTFADRAGMNSTSMMQLRLRNELNIKFSKSSRHGEFNQSTVMSRRKSSASLLINNPLTKSSFSVNDAITHKSSMKPVIQPLSQAPKKLTGSHNKIHSSYRQRYSSVNQSNLFNTRVDNHEKTEEAPRLKHAFSAREIISKRPKADPRLAETIQARRNKFKLLFKVQTEKTRTVSQRKIVKVDCKIEALKQKKNYIQSLMPKERVKMVVSRPKPRGQVIKKQKIMTLALNLIKYIQLYFNMYEYNNIVGGHIKKMEGFTNRVKDILMMDINRAKRISRVEEITDHFWAFKEPQTRPEYFGQEDLSLYNILNGFFLKMQKKYQQTLNKFNRFEVHKRSQEKMRNQGSKQRYESRYGKHESISKMNKFIQQRMRYDQTSREEYMSGLQKRGVKLNLIERSRELILREKEKAMKFAIKGIK